MAITTSLAKHRLPFAARLVGAGALSLAAGYGALAAVTWLRYGRPAPPAAAGERDPLLDRFMPRYDVVERHHIRVHAPAATTLEAAGEQDLLHSPVVRAIFRTREIVLGAPRVERPGPRGLLAEVQSLGWTVLAEEPGHEIVLGAVTRPWERRVTFHGLAAEAFALFDEPGYVKIAWTLRADPPGASDSMFRTETRAAATDAAARLRFRRYWTAFAPGIALIRRLMLAPLKRDAERRARTLDAAAARSASS